MSASARSDLLDVRDLSLRFKGAKANVVDGVSFSVAAGSTLCIVGESGCGKSVTALSLMGLLPMPPAEFVSGTARFDDRDLLSLSSRDLGDIRGNRMAMIFQEPMTSLNPILTIGFQIMEPIRIHLGLSDAKARERAIELLALVGIPDAERRLNQYPHQFSGGMRQRVMIAIGLACDPKLIIADEPTTALDVTIQAQILELMKDLTRELGVAMIIITHNLGVVARYADRVNVMYAGRIIESGVASDIYHRPRHPYTLALLKSVPRMDRQREAKLDPVDGQPPDLTKLDEGCSFRPRCRFAKDHCAESFPALEDIGDGHTSACFEKDNLEKEVKEVVG